MNITEFLEARIAEDEYEANVCLSQPEHTTRRWVRMLVECEAKRAILEMHAPIKEEGWKCGAANGYLWCGSCGSIDDSPVPYPCETLGALAGVYKDDPDYQQEWA